ERDRESGEAEPRERSRERSRANVETDTGAIRLSLRVAPITKPEDVNLILGQSHFIKTVEDLHEALVGSVPGIQFGLAFCESSGPALVRWSGTDDELERV